MKMLIQISMVFLLLISSTVLASEEGPQEPQVVSKRMFGVTIDNIGRLKRITESLSGLSVKPTTRVVFDEGMIPSYYKKAVDSIHKVSFVMGEIADSSTMKLYTVSEYVQRTIDYVDTLGDSVDIWEIGNEVNGEWLGTGVIEKILAANKVIKDRNLKSALTLYYNAACYPSKKYEMFNWVSTNIPKAIRSQFDYVLVSYYEDDCKGAQPNWHDVFMKLATEFPDSKIGFGECGTKYAAKKLSYLNRYYRSKFDDIPQFIGGYFWWYFYQDMVPKTKTLWNNLKLLSDEFKLENNETGDGSTEGKAVKGKISNGK